MDASHLPPFSVSVCLSLSGRVCVKTVSSCIYACIMMSTRGDVHICLNIFVP